jgi:hypothetical protein
VKYRYKMLPYWIDKPTKIFMNTFQLLSILGLTTLIFYFRQITVYIVNHPAALFPTSIFMMWMIISTIIRLIHIPSKESMLRIATNRLVSIDKKQRVLQNNIEAESLQNMLGKGKEKYIEGHFLGHLWEHILYKDGGINGLRLFTLPGHSDPLPIININIDGLLSTQPEAGGHSKEFLNSLLLVHVRTKYAGFSPSGQYINNGEMIFRRPYSRYLTRLRNTNNDFDFDFIGYNACLDELAIEEGTLKSISCTLELYGNILDSSDMLVNELYLQSASDHYDPAISPGVKMKMLPWRSKVHTLGNHSARILTHPTHRAAGFGISALTVYHDGNEYLAVRGKRASNVGTFQEDYHILPAGMANFPCENDYLNPNQGDVHYNLLGMIEKEFLEEWFGIKYDGVETETPAITRQRLQNDALNLLYGNGEYQVEIYLTGIVFDLLNYRPEICALIFFRNPKWSKNHNKYTGVSDTRACICPEFDEINPYVIKRVIDETACNDAMPPNQSCPGGIAAFHLGVRKARQLALIRR